jgi:hypothetical protein
VDSSMTVETYIHQFVGILKHQVSQQCEQERRSLHVQLEEVKAELRDKHRQIIASQELSNDNNESSEDQNNENERPSTAVAKSNVASASVNEKPLVKNNDENELNSIPTGVFVEIKKGMYEGQTFQLNPRPRSPCFIGRSTGKKFLERGISLSDDLEISTTHAKFEMKKGTLYFTDSGSTNGSFAADGALIEPGVPLELKDGLMITVGQCELHITLLY